MTDSTDNKATDSQTMAVQHHLDTQGLICPEPVMMLHRAVRQADAGELIEILATDPATTRDIPNFCRHLGHTLVDQEVSDDASIYRYVIKKKEA